MTLTELEPVQHPIATSRPPADAFARLPDGSRATPPFWRGVARRALRAAQRLIDVLLAPLTALSAAWLGTIRTAGVHRMPVARAILRGAGVFPIRDHYYEPMFHPRHLHRPLNAVRELPGLDLDVSGQLESLRSFDYAEELAAFPGPRPRERGFYFDNHTFGPGDADWLYSMIRHARPRRIVEIGSGHSTLIAAAAVRRNQELDPAYRCDHLCIEPYESPWLAEIGVRVLRERVERLDPATLATLERNDILFIDSSHVIRPQGDVLYEVLELLPRLGSGVLVHVHDVFTPRDLPEAWVRERVRFWNEQYLLEAFLSFNREFRVIGAVNHLAHEHPAEMAARFPGLRLRPESEPGSFWIVRR